MPIRPTTTSFDKVRTVRLCSVFCGTPAIKDISADDVVESGRTYTISTSASSVNLDLISTGSVYVKAIRIDKALGGETGIQDATLKVNDSRFHTQGIYDLTVTTPMKGHLYIINGKKVIY